MERVGVRELRQHASRYLKRVKRGEKVEVTERGRLVALLVPAGPSASARDQLIAAGELRPATASLRLPARVPADADSADILAESREEA